MAMIRWQVGRSLDFATVNGLIAVGRIGGGKKEKWAMGTTIEITEVAKAFDTCIIGDEIKPGMFAADSLFALAADLQVLLDGVDTDSLNDEPDSGMSEREYMFLDRLCQRMKLVATITGKLNVAAHQAEQQAVAQ